MADFELKNGRVVSIPIGVKNDKDVPEPIPTGAAFAAESSNPAAVNAAITTDAGGASYLTLNALVREAKDVTVTVTDTDGSNPASLVVDVIGNPAPLTVTLDTAAAISVPQAVPAGEPVVVEPPAPRAAIEPTPVVPQPVPHGDVIEGPTVI